jgi:pyruvate-formate lyase-activating enzyme
MNKQFWIQSEDTQVGKWQKTLTEISGSPTFCALPWIHFATRPNGDMRLCCSANASAPGVDHTVGLVKNERGEPANFGRETPMSAWNNEYMKDVRLTMMEGKIPASCNRCFTEESSGISSKRLWESLFWSQSDVDIPELIANTAEDGTVPEKLVYLDLRLGHTCQLKCVMCSPHDSSKWVDEHAKVYPTYQATELKRFMSWDKASFNNSWHENPDFWKEMYAQIPNLKQVYFAGGEPLIIKEHALFLEEIIRQGYADKIMIRYNTNGLLISKRMVDLWSKFKKVRIGFSLDAMDMRNWYIRYPSEWSNVMENLTMLDNAPDNIETSIVPAIQILNVKHLPDFVKWKVTSGFKRINLDLNPEGMLYGGGIFNMHVVHIPTWLNVQVLPAADKQEIVEKFAELKQWLWDNYTQDDDFWKNNPYAWPRYEAFLKFMLSNDKSHLLPAFKEYVEKLDSHRNTNAKEIFPELAHLL